nr:biopolymer transporter ExbD [Gemmatimonadaceae bacterium]
MAMSQNSNSGGGVKAEPNVTPMIDVMLVLLIIFMVVTPALLAGFNAQPPQGQNLKDHPEDAELDQVLGIDKDGAYYLNKKPVAKTAIEAEIKRIYEARTV